MEHRAQVRLRRDTDYMSIFSAKERAELMALRRSTAAQEDRMIGTG